MADSGALFTVIVSNTAGTVTSPAATLTVTAAIIPPSVTTPPTDVTVTAPTSATFSVGASGTAPLSYQWQRNGTAIAGATSATYLLSPTAVADSGAQFAVVVSNIGRHGHESGRHVDRDRGHRPPQRDDAAD